MQTSYHADNRQPLFSIVMPAYNAAEFIGEAIDSVLSQSHTDWELIIVDDGSDDFTAGIAGKYSAADSRITLLRAASNSGSAYVPRKRAIEASRGKYIISLDADDTLAPGFIDSVATRIKTTGADCVYCRLRRENAELPIAGFDTSVMYRGRDLLKYTLCGWSIAPNGAVRRDLYMKAFEKYPVKLSEINGDELLSRQIMTDASRIAFCDAVYLYRVSPNSISQNHDVRKFDILTIDVMLRELVNYNYPEGSEERRLMARHLFNDVTGMISHLAAHRELYRRDRNRIDAIIGHARKAIDWNLLDRNPACVVKAALLRADTRMFKTAMAIYDKIKGRKQL